MIKPLTSLRFIFALMVFFSHCYVAPYPDAWLNKLWLDYLSEGFVGVECFFVLSGFILSYRYSEKLQSGSISVGEFWWRRFTRIYPLYIFILVLSLSLKLYDLKADTLRVLVKFAGHCLLLQGFFPNIDFVLYFNPPAWSISDEAFFYLLFPFLIAWLPSIRKGLIFLALAGLALTILMNLSTRPGYTHQFYVNPFPRCFEFILGIVAYRISRRNPGHEPGRIFAAVLEIGSLVLFGVFLYLHQHIQLIYRYSIYYALPVAFIIYAFSFQRGIVSKFLSHPVLVYLGEISFAFYLLHILIKYGCSIYFKSLGWHYSNIGFIAVWFCITLIASMVCHAFIEKPARNQLRRLVR